MQTARGPIAFGAGMLMLGVGAALLWTRATLRDEVAQLGTADPARLAALEAEIASLRARFETPIAHDAIAPPPARTAVAPASAPEAGVGLEPRLAALEATLLALRQRVDRLELGPPLDTADAILAALAEIDPPGVAPRPENAKKRIPLRERFLAEHPAEPRLGEQVKDLANDYLATQQHAQALDLLQRLGERISSERWRVESVREYVLAANGRYDESRAANEAVLRDPTSPEWARANARFRQAYVFASERRYAEARAGFEGLIAAYGDTPPPQVVHAVDGAKKQIEQIEKAQRAEAGRRGR